MYTFTGCFRASATPFNATSPNCCLVQVLFISAAISDATLCQMLIYDVLGYCLFLRFCVTIITLEWSNLDMDLVVSNKYSTMETYSTTDVR